jgi:hypothetical protein
MRTCVVNQFPHLQKVFRRREHVTDHSFVEQQNSDRFRDDRIHLMLFVMASQDLRDLRLGLRRLNLSPDDPYRSEMMVDIVLFRNVDKLSQETDQRKITCHQTDDSPT